MRRILLAALCAALFVFPALANDKDKGVFEFFSDEVPLYSGFAAGGFMQSQFALGEWSDFAVATLGAGVDLEYTLPIELPKNLRLGICEHIDYAHIFPKSGSNLKRGDDVSFSTGVFFRIPFLAWGQAFAFQPEISYAIFLHNVEGQNQSRAKGWYSDQAISLAPALRWMPKNLKGFPQIMRDSFEFEFSPIYTISLENQHTLNQLGFRLGAVWHFGGTKGDGAQASRQNEAASSDASEKEKALLQKQLEDERAENERLKKELEERRALEEKRLEEERQAKERLEREQAEQRALEEKQAQEKKAELQKSLAAVRQSPELLLGVDKAELSAFSPDGDGHNDTITFRPAASYMSEPPEKWSLVILDPSGNAFRTWSGEGFPPKEIVWDGKGDMGDVVFSESSYKAALSVAPSKADREILGLDSMSASVDGEVQIDTEIVMRQSGEGEWRIAMTKFRFDPNQATFNQLNAEQRADLEETLSHLVAKFKNMKDAVITVEGYANNLSGTKEENENELVPLSQKRAEAIMELLAEHGIERERLDAKGMGDANPIASREDKANWWKNRRIEFLIKKQLSE